jgi:hypothetical protein
MKKNTFKLLSLLQSETAGELLVSTKHLPWLWSDLTPAGQRSLLRHIKTKGLINLEPNQVGETALFISQLGQQYLSQRIPVFSRHTSPWGGEWVMLVFGQAPNGDAQFRYLRQLILNSGGIQVSRGSYLLAWPVIDSLWWELQQRYLSAVVVVKVEKWIIGEERALIVDGLGLTDLAAAYSGISNEISELLSKRYHFPSLNHSKKTALFSVFDRLITLIQKDQGLLQHYFPTVAAPQHLLREFRQLISY